MKRIISILLVCLLIAGLSVSASAEAKQTFTFDLSAQGDYEDPHDIIVKAGTIITVEYRLTVDDANGATALTQNEINYDTDFFTFVEGSIKADSRYGNGMTYSNKQRLNGECFVFFNNGSSKGFSDGVGDNPSVIGTFQLAVKKTATGSSAVNSRNYGAKTTANEIYGTNIVNLRVTVEGTNPTIPVIRTSLNKDNMTIKANETETLVVDFEPADASNRNVSWSSSNTAVATVDANGMVTAKSEGTAIITVKTQDGGKTASCTVTVTKGDAFTVTSSCGKGGTITPEGAQSVRKGENLTFNFIADENYAIKDVKIDGVSDAAAAEKGSYSFSKVEKDHTISVTFERTDGKIDNPFTDVKDGEYYYDAVLWAAENGITQGTSATTFGPNVPVTRAQVVTFLWRTAGCPAPAGSASRFTDVKVGSYYEKAVAWAIEQGITKGTSETTFSPDTVCTRGQIVTFLARFAGVPDTATQSGFTDVNPSDYYSAAVKWAKDNGVTEGTSATTFSPKQNCTRAQVVTFLYRWMVR